MKDFVFPESIQIALKDNKVKKANISFVFESMAFPTGETGESFFVFAKPRLYIFSRQLLGNFELFTTISKDAMNSVMARENNLGNLEISFQDLNQSILFIEILSLQKNLWGELCEQLKTFFPNQFESENFESGVAENNSLVALFEKVNPLAADGILFLETIPVAEDLENAMANLRSLVPIVESHGSEYSEMLAPPSIQVSSVSLDEVHFPQMEHLVEAKPEPPKPPLPKKGFKPPKPLKDKRAAAQPLITGGSFYSSSIRPIEERTVTCSDEVLGCIAVIFTGGIIIWGILSFLGQL